MGYNLLKLNCWINLSFLTKFAIARLFYRSFYKGLTPLALDPYLVSLEAASLYRSLRKKGLTIRKPNDCLIAYCAIHFDLELCHNDSDFNIIASGSPLKIWKPF